MRHKSNRRPWFMLGIGLSVGLLMGVGMLVGAIVAFQSQQSPWDDIQLQATATHGSDNFAMATGFIADSVEGVFFLDYLTGELQCYVVNRRTGGLAGVFKHNVIVDLGIEQGKKPNYLMVTGHANFQRGGGRFRPAETVVYVADANTGRFAAYSLPWNPNAIPNNQEQFNPMVLIGKGSARNLTIRE